MLFEPNQPQTKNWSERREHPWASTCTRAREQRPSSSQLTASSTANIRMWKAAPCWEPPAAAAAPHQRSRSLPPSPAERHSSPCGSQRDFLAPFSHTASVRHNSWNETRPPATECKGKVVIPLPLDKVLLNLRFILLSTQATTSGSNGY